MAKGKRKRGVPKKKQTPNQIAYKKQLSRIKKAINKLEKSGYIFEVDVVPVTPGKIYKKDIETLKAITPNTLRDLASEFVDYETGELFDVETGKKIEKENRERERLDKQRSKQGTKKKQPKQEWQDSDFDYPNGGEMVFNNVYESFISRLSQPVPEDYVNRNGKRKKRWNLLVQESQRAKSSLLSICEQVVAKDGVEKVGNRLQQHGDEVDSLTDYILFGSDATQIASCTTRLAVILKGSGLSMDEYTDLAEQEEYNESWGGEMYNED